MQTPRARSRFRSWLACALGGVMLCGSAGAPGAAPENRGASFDCAKASTRIEKMICSDGEASDLDGQLARAYRDALSRATSRSFRRFLRA
jgi:uncharacterized protein